MVKIALISLGCNKNLVDSELILGLLAKRGYAITDDETEADIIIVNTCAFIHDAKQESINKIIEMGKLKDENCKSLIVTGCLAKRYEKEIKEALPEVDKIAMINDNEAIIDYIDKVLPNDSDKTVRSISYGERIRATAPHSAYVKIADGCNNHCTYCVIPSIRGEYKSRTMEDIEEEIRMLVNDGVTEIILTAQDTTYYGLDIYGKRSLAELIKRVRKIDGIHWLRFQYAYPEGITDELLSVVSETEMAVPYFDIPIQHCNNGILKLMGRKTSKEAILGLIKKIRAIMPNAILRTSLIVGFPGETDEQFEELVEFVKDVKFDKLGVFTYSKEEGTGAAKMKCQILKSVKNRRRKKIMEIQQMVSYNKNQEKIGQEIEVLVEGKLPDGTFFGRTYQDSPEIDGFAFIESERDLVLGEYYPTKIIGAKEYDIVCEIS